MVMFPGARFKDPELSWKYEVAPGGIGFLDSRELGSAATAATCSWPARATCSRAATCSGSS